MTRPGLALACLVLAVLGQRNESGAGEPCPSSQPVVAVAVTSTQRAPLAQPLPAAAARASVRARLRDRYTFANLKESAARQRALASSERIIEPFAEAAHELPEGMRSPEGIEWYVDSVTRLLPPGESVAEMAPTDLERQVATIRAEIRKWMPAVPSQPVSAEQRRRRTENYGAYVRAAGKLLISVLREHGLDAAAPPDQMDQLAELVGKRVDAEVSRAPLVTESVFCGKPGAAFDKDPYDEAKLREYFEAALPEGPLAYTPLLRAATFSLMAHVSRVVLPTAPFGEASAADVAARVRSSLLQAHTATRPAPGAVILLERNISSDGIPTTRADRE